MANTSINDFLGAVALRGISLLKASERNQKPEANTIVELCKRLLSSRGNASGLALSFQFWELYAKLDDPAKEALFLAISTEFSADLENVAAVASQYIETKSPEVLKVLSSVATPKYAELISRLNQTPASTLKIVHMRADLLRFLRQNPSLKPLDEVFSQVLTSWFNRGFLRLQEINWHSPAILLENVKKYEAVHGIENWNDLARRIQPADRQIYGFFHHNLQDEPLIFVEVALTTKIPDAIAPILEDDRKVIDPNTATTAVFYSISNCQEGLRGIPLGNFLIKQVVEELKKQHPQLKEFVTLSPIVRFGKWMRDNPEVAKTLPTTEDEINAMTPEAKRSLLADAAWFLSSEKASDGKPLDPVCRFHIGNGARLERLNWAAHFTGTGPANSFAIMANYKYIIDDIEKNHEAFQSAGTVAIAPPIKKQAAQSQFNKS